MRMVNYFKTQELAKKLGPVKNQAKTQPPKPGSTTRPNLPVEESENPAENHTSPGSFKTDSATPDVLETEGFNPQENHSKKTVFSRPNEPKLSLKLTMKQKLPAKPVSVDKSEANSTVNNIDIIEIFSKIHGK